MCMGMSGGLFSLSQTVVLLAVSFFVLSAALKHNSQGLKTFGIAIAVLLWIAAALVLGKSLTARYCKMNKMNMLKERASMMTSGAQQQVNTSTTAR